MISLCFSYLILWEANIDYFAMRILAVYRSDSIDYRAIEDSVMINVIESSCIDLS